MLVFFLLAALLKSSDANTLFASADSIEGRLDVKLKELENKLDSMNERWLSSEMKNKLLREEMQNMNKRWLDTEKAMKTELRQLTEKLKSASCRESTHQMEENVYQRIVSNMKDSPVNVSTKDSILTRTSTKLHRRLLMPDSNHRIAFTAVLTHEVTLGFHQTIEFDKVITNIGNAYDPSDGHFRATVRGLYILSVSMLGHHDKTQPIEMVRNGIQISSIFLDGLNYNMGSQTVVALLEKGDKIWMRRYRDVGSASLYAQPNETYNSFSGVLLYEM